MQSPIGAMSQGDKYGALCVNSGAECKGVLHQRECAVMCGRRGAVTGGSCILRTSKRNLELGRYSPIFVVDYRWE